MDLGSPQETLAGIGGLAGLIAALKMMYNDHCYRQDKAAMEAHIARYKTALDARLEDQDKRLNQQDQEIASHAVLVARDYVLKTDMDKLKEHIDAQFTEIRAMFAETRAMIFAALTNKPVT